ncbi:exodeoxyribonuclease V alpha subunit [Lachnospiraceae bacterium PFB1-21]
METVKGYVDHIIYRSEDTGYSVFILENKDGESTCVGNFPVIEEGELLELDGETVLHPSYGTQFKVKDARRCEPDDLHSMEVYLGSGTIKGLGTVLAGKIVEHFGEETFKVIEEEPERLAEIKGISGKKAMEIALQMESKKELRRGMIYLQKFGISTNLAVKIYKEYGESVYNVIEENPYKLAETVDGIGFKIADQIAINAGFKLDSEFRIQSGILYALQQGIASGSVYMLEAELMGLTASLLEVELSEITRFLMDLAIDKKIVIKDEEGDKKIYLSHFYYMELEVAARLKELDQKFSIDHERVSEDIEKIEKEATTVLDETQQLAILRAMENGVSILTGGPGTGKTTTISTMIRLFIENGLEVLLAAPTGRAAKRMSETTGYEAKTIHRLLEVSGAPEGRGSSFSRNEENPLEADVIIVDEMSMIDISLMHSLLKAALKGCRLVFVGDRNQLPSVGAGAVLEDMIKADQFATTTLEKIFRQASKSDIVVNAHKINRGEEVMLDNKSADFFFLKRYDPRVIVAVIIRLITENLPQYLKLSPLDIQVITPTRIGAVGVEQLNVALQERLNPPAAGKAEKKVSFGVLRVDDKVMQTKNNYQLEWQVRTKFGLTIDKGVGIFNGDIGIVKRIDNYQLEVEIEFDDERVVSYPFGNLDELELAYAITVHKSQGSEYPAVVMPMYSGPRMLMHRNLLYTAITRAKNLVTLVGDEKVFAQMINNEYISERNTSLSERIQELYEEYQ